MNVKLKSIIKPFYRFCKIIWQLNIIKTLYINFKKLPFSQAIHIPVYVYGGLQIDSLKGEIVIRHPIKSGMIKIGYDVDGVPYSCLRSRLIIRGKLLFDGYTLIGKGSVITIEKEGKLRIGNCCTIGSGSVVKCIDKISIGDNSRITFGCTILDCNMHYVKNVESGIIKKNRAPILIGKNCWINAGTIINKGVVLIDYCITGRNSYLSKDYSSYGNNLFLVGSPAKILDIKVQRIFSSEKEKEFNYFFKENPHVDYIQLSGGLFEETNNEDWFKWNI